MTDLPVLTVPALESRTLSLELDLAEVAGLNIADGASLVWVRIVAGKRTFKAALLAKELSKVQATIARHGAAHVDCTLYGTVARGGELLPCCLKTLVRRGRATAPSFAWHARP